MARGWESKSVEAQQADLGSARTQGAALSPAERERRQHADTLKLALADATAQLQAACKPVHRDMLQQRVTAIQERLADLMQGRS